MPEKKKKKGKRHAHQIGIPHPHSILHADLAHQEAVHPPKRELHKLDALRGEVLGERRVDACDKLRHALHAALDARLRGDVVFWDPVEQTREAPKRIGLGGGEDGGGKDRGIDLFGIGICVHLGHQTVSFVAGKSPALTEVCGQEHFEEGRGEIVYSLDVSTGGMPYRPDVQYTLQTL